MPMKPKLNSGLTATGGLFLDPIPRRQVPGVNAT
jgi:hypothetical protein